MKPGLLLLETMLPEIEARLDALCAVHRSLDAHTRRTAVPPDAAGLRAIVTGGGIGADNALIDALPNLAIIAINGIGTDAVDLAHCKARGVRVTTTPGVLTDDVADMAIGLMLAVSRRLAQGDRFVRAGRWPGGGMPLARAVTRKRLGIFGMGRVGRAIAHRGAAFGMTTGFTDTHDDHLPPHVRLPSLPALAEWADVLVVAASAGPGSRGIVDAAVLDALGPDGILINVARGSLVDEPALVAALQAGRLGGAGLDVFASEPQVPAALWAMDNVALSPHAASATVETRIAMGELVVANVEAVLAGREPPTAIV